MPVNDDGNSEHRPYDLNQFQIHLAAFAQSATLTYALEALDCGKLLPKGSPKSIVRRAQGLLDAMTPWERSNPDLIDADRRRRIAAGAGVAEETVATFLKEFRRMRSVIEESREYRDPAHVLSTLGAWNQEPHEGYFNEGPHSWN